MPIGSTPPCSKKSRSSVASTASIEHLRHLLEGDVDAVLLGAEGGDGVVRPAAGGDVRRADERRLAQRVLGREVDVEDDRRHAAGGRHAHEADTNRPRRQRQSALRRLAGRRARGTGRGRAGPGPSWPPSARWRGVGAGSSGTTEVGRAGAGLRHVRRRPPAAPPRPAHARAPRPGGQLRPRRPGRGPLRRRRSSIDGGQAGASGATATTAATPTSAARSSRPRSRRRRSARRRPRARAAAAAPRATNTRTGRSPPGAGPASTAAATTPAGTIRSGSGRRPRASTTAVAASHEPTAAAARPHATGGPEDGLGAGQRLERGGAPPPGRGQERAPDRRRAWSGAAEDDQEQAEHERLAPRRHPEHEGTGRHGRGRRRRDGAGQPRPSRKVRARWFHEQEGHTSTT